MTNEEAFRAFSDWYDRCIESGIFPEEIVSQMGGMELILNTDEAESDEDDARDMLLRAWDTINVQNAKIAELESACASNLGVGDVRVEMLDDKIWNLVEQRDALAEELNKFRTGYQGACYACEPVGELNQKLAFLVKEFFRLLDTVEESDSGQEFHPITISCCRTMMMEPLNNILKEMKGLAR